MRLNEIEDIKSHEFSKYFSIFPNQRKNVILSSTGIIVDGDCTIKKEVKKLPFKFSKITGNLILDRSGILMTLEGCPEYIGGSFQCYDNQLTTLVGGPKKVKDFYGVSGNPIISLDGLPEYVGGEFNISYNENLQLLRLLSINGLQRVEILIDSDKERLSILENILNKYLGKGRKGAIACAAELTKAGYKGNAKL